MQYKVCTKCGESKPIEEYFKASKRPDGLQTACKPCMNTLYKSSRGKKPEH